MNSERFIESDLDAFVVIKDNSRLGRKLKKRTKRVLLEPDSFVNPQKLSAEQLQKEVL